MVIIDDYKTWLAALAVFLTFYAYIPYLRGIFAGRTKPHFFTWVIWSLVSFIAVGIQVVEGGGTGAWPTIAAVVICFFITLLSVRNRAENIKPVDWVFLAAALGAIQLWLLADEPATAALLVTGIEIIGALPTLRKSWNKPHEEVASAYGINTVRYVLSILALASFSVSTLAYPLGMVFMNGLIFGVLILRQNMLRN